MLLSILKAISEGLTAGFGILGLLTEFKDEKTKSITRNGKIALVGILASFIVSGIITVVENRDALAEHVEHAKEVERLSRRLGQLSLALDFKLKTGKTEGSTISSSGLGNVPSHIGRPPTKIFLLLGKVVCPAMAY